MAVKAYYFSRSSKIQFLYYGSVERISLNDYGEAVIEFSDLDPVAMKLESQEYVDFMLGFQEYLESDEE